MSKAPSDLKPLSGSERPPAKGARVIGPLDPKQTLSVTIVVRRRPGSPPLPSFDHWSGVTPGHRDFLSVSEFAEKYGATQEDMDKVSAFAKSRGLEVVEENLARRTVVVSGTTSKMNETFGVQLKQFEAPIPGGKRRRAPKAKGQEEPPKTQIHRGFHGAVQLPSELVDVVSDIVGLDNRRLGGVNTPSGAPPGTGTTTVPQVAQLYGFPNTGAHHQTIGIFCAGGNYDPNDITSYFGSLPAGYNNAPTIQDVNLTVDGTTYSNDSTEPRSAGGPGLADYEIGQDIQIAATVAQNATVAVYFTIDNEDGWLAWLNAATLPVAGQPEPSVLSTSWIFNRQDDAATVGTGVLNTLSAAFAQAAVRGITVFVALGDSGSDDVIPDGKCHVQYAGSDPWVTSCGGTVIGNVNLGPPATFEEWVWSGGSADGATGGGVSDYFPVPSWQTAAGVAQKSLNDNLVRRGVPDVAGNADPNSGYSNIVIGGSAFTGNGTSAVAPLYAGLIAVLNETLGQPIGYLNPTLYALGESVFNDVTQGNNDPDDGSGAKFYNAGVGWDACTGWGSIDGTALLEALQQIYAKQVSFTTDRSTYGQDEIDALRTQPGGAVVKSAFFVTVDGFTPKDLGITGTTSLSAAPVVTFSPSTGVTNPAACTSLESDDPSFGPEVQRFRFGYDVNFGSDDTAFTSFMGDSEPVTLNTTFQGITANAQVQFIKQPDPYILQGPQTWWLSNDIRLVQVAQGDTKFGVQMNTDPFAFLTGVTAALESGQGIAGGQTFDSNTQEDSETISVAPQNSGGKNVYNFAIARVHYQGLMSKARSVRVFFRLFAANSTATDFQPDTTYRRYAAYSPSYPVPATDDFQNVLPELGVEAGEYVTVPCFAEARQDATQAGSPNTLPSLQTPDGPNVRDLLATGGPLHDTFYGCWLDINQSTPALPSAPPSGNEDGPWPGLTLGSIRQAFIANEHTCLVAEIAFDPVPISTGTVPFNTDKLAQRNISWSYVANPGVEASRRAMEPFEVRPTPPEVSEGQPFDELMIDWNSVPVGQSAQIYLPAMDADAVVSAAAELYAAEHLYRVDAHTLGCTTGGVTYIPIPKGDGTGANFTGLLSVNLPPGIKKGQQFTVLVRQVTSVEGRGAIVEAGPGKPALNATEAAAISWRRVLGTFQVNIPVSTKEILLPREEQRLSIFRWMAEAMPKQRRWYPVFQRYLEGIADKVQALGGDPTKILPSPTGDGRVKGPAHEERHEALTGKVTGLLFDRFGDFEGFILETEYKEHRLLSRENGVERLADRAWREHLRITVWVDRDELHRPLSFMVHEPPATFGHETRDE